MAEKSFQADEVYHRETRRASDHAHHPAEELQRGRAGLAFVPESVPLGPAHPVHLVLPLHPAEGIAGPPLRIAILKQDHEM